MKLKLIRRVNNSDGESWRWLALFEVLEGEDYAPPPHDAGRVGAVIEYEDWQGEVYEAARECGVEIADAGDGYPGGPFAREPDITWWKHAAPVSLGVVAHLTIEQSGGLDV